MENVQHYTGAASGGGMTTLRWADEGSFFFLFFSFSASSTDPYSNHRFQLRAEKLCSSNDLSFVVLSRSLIFRVDAAPPVPHGPSHLVQ